MWIANVTPLKTMYTNIVKSLIFKTFRFFKENDCINITMIAAAAAATTTITTDTTTNNTTTIAMV
jgi:hypothetical protein